MVCVCVCVGGSAMRQTMGEQPQSLQGSRCPHWMAPAKWRIMACTALWSPSGLPPGRACLAWTFGTAATRSAFWPAVCISTESQGHAHGCTK